MAGQMFECPHCKFETLLFIPPADKPAHQSAPAKKRISLVWWIISGAALATFLFLAGFALLQVSPKQTKQTTFEPTQSAPEQPNLKPVVGAFGLKLGDKIPEGFVFDDSTVKTMEPFNDFDADVTEDGHICCITVMGHADEIGADDSKKRLIAVLTEKYGLRYQAPKTGVNDKSEENYDFGTVDQTAHLKILGGNYFYLDYYDKKLQQIYFDEQEVKRQKDEEDKKAALKRGL
jgi:hypothetical protein